ncbi:MAG: Holliday junction branch migration protein RuvA [Anaerolineae bacterium]
MIASLTGALTALGKDSVVIQVGGVGFRVFVPRRFLDTVVGSEREITLFTHLHVRENEFTLYGFATEEEVTLFRLLQTVPGVGPKAALSLLSALTPGQFQAAIAQEDMATLARVPGVGPKTAKKLMFDLKDKVVSELPPSELRPVIGEADADLIAALTSLGYSVAEVQEAIRALPREPLPLEERVRLALTYFAS